MPATWDNGVWDTLTWDAAEPGQPFNRMVKLKTGLSKLKFTDKVTRMKAVEVAMTGNASFVSPNPSLATYGAKIDAIDAKLLEIDNTETHLDMLRQQRDLLIKEGELLYAQLGADVANQSGDDRAKAASSGYELVDETPATPAPLVKPENVSASTGDNEGELDVQWDSLAGVDAFIIQVSADPNVGPWLHAGVVAVSRFTLTNQPHMTRRWVRVAGIRGSEQGPFSDPAAGIVS